MYKVLIAEDELLTRAGIVSSVNWAELNMQIVAQADDGIQALQLYRTHYPEIVVTDLNMPRLGGVELIGKICEEERPCKIIVVTCVEDVQVITRLFPYRIFDFLLKSAISPEELQEKLSQAGRELALEGVASGAASGIRTDEQLLGDFLDRSEGALPFEVSPYWLLFRLHIRGGNKAILSKAVRDLLAEYFLNHSDTVADCRNDMEFTVCFKNRALSEEELIHRVQLFGKYVYKAFDQELACDLECCQEPAEIREKRDAFFRLGGHVRGQGAGIQKGQASFLIGYVANISSLYAINTFCGKNRQIYYENIVKPTVQTTGQAGFSFYEYRQAVVAGMEAFCRELPVFPPEELTERLQGILDEDTYEGVYLRCRDMLRSRGDVLDGGDCGYDEIRQSLRYIQENRGGKIALNDVAEQVSFSPSYFSTLFKRAMGISFSTYLTFYRIQHAMELLEDESVFLYEIAEKTGIGDLSHFSKTFKTVTGYSPNAWRKCVRNEEFLSGPKASAKKS